MRRTQLVLLAWLSTSLPALADNIQPSPSDFGGAGLLQTPTARMFEAGEVGVSMSNVAPYRHGNLTFQPMDWLEANVRYTHVNNRKYDPSATISNNDYTDKSIDFKFALVDEDYATPAIALGFRDVGGTGLFASEYFVANKRFGRVDVSLGIAWGYLGSRGDIDNPFSMVFGDKYDSRPGREKDDMGGNVNTQNFFRGEPAFFGGVEYQTPWQPLVLKLEYEGNDYQHEGLGNNLEQDSRVNAGAVFKISDSFSLNAGLERGNKTMLGFNLHTNFGQAKPLPKSSDPKPEALKSPSAIDTRKTDWKDVTKRMQDNAGYTVTEIGLREKEIVMRGEQVTYFAHAEGIGRAARIMHNSVDADVEWITVIDEVKGVPVKETSLSREQLQKVVNHDADIDSLRRTLSESAASTQEQSIVYRNSAPRPFDFGLGIGYQQSLGGPDEFLLYQFTGEASAEYYFRRNLWWSGGLSVALLDNYDKFKYDGPSLLPRVRTDLRQYLTTSDIMMPDFQLNYVNQLNDDVFYLLSAGIFETMYGGVGGEILYRPFGERLSFGMDVNWVKQRAYEQDFNFRDYETVTGHLTAYWNTGIDGVLVTASGGRYLAEDWGVTIDVSRSFKNGVRMGGFFTRTDVSQEEFGEGSFDKGIYISIPFDLMLTSSVLRQATLEWTPLTRDGGAKLYRKNTLYDITEDRSLDHFHNSFHHITD